MNGSTGAASNYPPAHEQARGSVIPHFQRWQLASRLELCPLPSAVPCARPHAIDAETGRGLEIVSL